MKLNLGCGKAIERINDACNYISEVAWQHKHFGRWALHKLCYYDVTVPSAKAEGF